MTTLVINTNINADVPEVDGMTTPKAKPQSTVCPGAPKKKVQKNNNQNLIAMHFSYQCDIKSHK